MEIKKNVKIMKFGEADSNGNIFSKENLKFPKDKIKVYSSNFDGGKPPIGEAYDFRVEDNFLICDMEIFDNVGFTVAPKMRVDEEKSKKTKDGTIWTGVDLQSLSIVPLHAIQELNNNLDTE